MLRNLLSVCSLMTVVALTGSQSYAAEPDYRKWQWTEKIPTELKTTQQRTNRTPAKFAEAFKIGPPPVVQVVLDTFGLPDHISDQFMYSHSKGVGDGTKGGITMRFKLDGGSEVHVFTGDFVHIGLAISYDKKGRGTLLWK